MSVHLMTNNTEDCSRVYGTLVPRTLNDYIICTGAYVSATTSAILVKTSVIVTSQGGKLASDDLYC